MRLLGAFLAFVVVLGAASCTPGERNTTIVAEFEDVGDLVTRSNVQRSDAVIGTVTSIDLDTERWVARVTMRIGRDASVPEGSGAVVRATSLLGEKYVDIVPPPDVTPATPDLPDGAVIELDRTDKAPELENVLSELGGILASGALEDLGIIITASARIAEEQEEEIARALDGTANLIGSLARQRDALAGALDRAQSAAGTFATDTEIIDRFLRTSDEVVGLLAEQRGDIGRLIEELDRLGGPSARLMDAHAGDIDRTVKALLEIIPKLHEARGSLDAALSKLPDFAQLFGQAIPGDYIQLDVGFEDPTAVLGAEVPGSADGGSRGRGGISSLLWEATR